MVLGAVATLAAAGAARADVITVAPDGAGGTDNLAAAITVANTDAAPANTLVLEPGRYAPGTPLPPVTKPLTITGDHALQAEGSQAATDIDGSDVTGASALFTVGAGARLTLEALQIENAPAAAIADQGHLVTWGVTIAGAGGAGLQVLAHARAWLNETTVDGAGGDGIDVVGGSLVLANSDVVNGRSAGVALAGGSASGLNALIAHNASSDCSGGRLRGFTSMDDDGTCGVRYSDVGYWRAQGTFPRLAANGGPTLTDALADGSPVAGRGRLCPRTDARFFVNPRRAGRLLPTCDIGALTGAAVRQISAPRCTVTLVRYPTGYPSSRRGVAVEQVTVTDAGSGLGPEAGQASDPQPPNAINPADAVSNLVITNGTVAFGRWPVPHGTLRLTAFKSMQGVATVWSFTATNWAGLSTRCA